MSRGWILFTCGALALASCVPKGGVAEGEHHTIVTTKADGIPLRVINHTKSPITRFEMDALGAGAHDTLTQTIAPGGQFETKVDGSKLADHEMMMTIWAGQEVLVDNAVKFRFEGPTQIDIVEDENAAPAVAAGFTQDVRLTVAKQRERDAAAAQAIANAEAARCQTTIDAASGHPAPGKTKAQGKFKCVFGGAFDGSMNIQMVQLADGKITATLTEFGGGTVANNTWNGILVGDQVHFAWSGLPSAGSAKIDPGGRALLGNGVSLADGKCVNWTLTCTR